MRKYLLTEEIFLSIGTKLAAAEIAPCRDEQEEKIMAEVIKYVMFLSPLAH